MKLWKGIKYWSQALLLPVYGLSYLIPRSKRTWLLGSSFGKRFADNPKYFYLYLSQYQKKNIKPVWISHKKDIVQMLRASGYQAYHHRSLKGMWYCLHAGVYIFDNYSKDISFWLSGGALKINLWHGVGNKKINYDNRFDLIRHPRNKWESFKTYLRRLSDEKPYHYTLATSPVKKKIFASAFRTEEAHIIEDGLPRNDVLLNSEIKNFYTEQERKLLKEIDVWKQEKKLINCYMPTFRKSESKFFEVMELQRFNDFLVKNNMMFLMKLHPKSTLRDRFQQIHFSNIVNIDADVDPYTFLNQVDILTTDYSSIYTDFMLLNRPVVGFYYDYELYSTETRDCYFNFEEYMPEIKAKSMEELMEAILHVMKADECKEKRMKSRDRMFSKTDGRACSSIYDKIWKILKEK